MVKLGGATLGSHDTAITDMVALQKQGKSLVVVHGGGKLITEWLEKQEISTRFVRGQRVTDKATLEVATSVLAGLVNKEIVAGINELGGKAAGISGVDGALLQCKIKDRELGYVGTVVKINLAPLEAILLSGYIPVVAPIGLYSVDKPDGAPLMLNINADAVAGEIAAAVGAERLIFLTDVEGIRDRSGNLLTQLSPDEAEALVASGVISGGMIPKVEAGLRVLSVATTASIIDGRQSHALRSEIEGHGSGTVIGGRR
ncbi:Acetylglutamate kinase [subsurface metagenome]